MIRFSLLLSLVLLFSATDVCAQTNSSEIPQNLAETQKHDLSEKKIELFSEKNTEKKEPTLDELKEKAHSGDVETQLDLGYMYLYGVKGVNTDYKLAFHYYEMAAEKDNPVALNNLGSLYFSGIGTEVNYPKAIEYFEKAAKVGSNDAAVNLAIIYLGSKNNPKTQNDLKKVFMLLEQAQEENNVAKYLIGYAYSQGFYYKKDINKAFKLIKAAANAGYDEAQFIISNFYTNGIGTPKNYARAVENLQAASKQGHTLAIMKLADILNDGLIYTKDISQAHVLYNIASVMGAEGAAEKRDIIEKNLKIENLLKVQADAENYKPEPTELTIFIKKTFGNSLKIYIDSNINNDISADLKN